MKIADTRRRLALFGLPALAVLFALLVLPPLASTTASQPVAATPTPTAPVKPPAPKAEPLCGRNTGPHYYAFDAPKEGEHAFGPKAPMDPNRAFDASEELWRRLCGVVESDGTTTVGGDWALLRAIQGMVDGTDPNRPFTAKEWQEQVRDMEARIVWNSYQVVREDAYYGSLFTLYMTGTPGQQPTIHLAWKDEQKPSSYLYITVRMQEGGTVRLKLRLDCGFQPVFYNAHESPKGLT